MQVGRRPTQFGACQMAGKCVEDELHHQPESRQPEVIPLQPTSLNHLLVFNYKRPCLVVCTLTDDIFDHDTLLALADGERALFLSPSAELWKICLLLRPLATALLDVTNQVTQCHGRRQFNEHVDILVQALAG